MSMLIYGLRYFGRVSRRILAFPAAAANGNLGKVSRGVLCGRGT